MLKMLIGLLVASSTMLTGVKAEADAKPKYECDIIYGVVLDAEKNGRVVVDADPEYNYISYRGVDAKPGEVVKTYAFVDEYGDVEYRFDEVCPIFVDRYEGEDTEYVVFEILDGNNTVMGECPSSIFVDAPNLYDIH